MYIHMNMRGGPPPPRAPELLCQTNTKKLISFPAHTHTS